MFLFLFIIYFVLAWRLAAKILPKIFPVDKKIINLLSGFAPLFVLGPVANIFTAWLILNNYTVVLAGLLSLALLAIASRLLKDSPDLTAEETATDTGVKFANWLWLVFGLALLAGWAMIFTHISGSRLISPWQILPAGQLIFIFIAAAIAVWAIMSQEKFWRVLVAIIFLSLLAHSYLLVYQNGFGGDRFRHLGSEQRILSELEYQPTLLTRDLWWQKIGPLSVPQALIDSAKLSYGTMWSLEAIMSKVTGLGVFEVNRFFLPLIFSIFLPLLAVIIALLLWPSRRFALFSGLVTSGLYLLQYYGAQGLPAGYGLLWLAFYLALLIAYLKSPKRSLLIILIGGLCLMYFNYSLAFILAGAALVIGLADKKSKILSGTAAAIALVGLMFLDYLSSPQINFSLKKIYDAWTSGNLLYFSSADRLSQWIGRGQVILDLFIAVVFVSVVSYLLYVFLKKDKSWRLLAYLFIITISAYLLSWLMFSGEHSLARRITLFAVWPLVFLLAYGLTKISNSKKTALAVTAVLPLAMVFNYWSGPVLNVTVSDRDLSKAQAMWQDWRGQSNYCVRDDLEVILALEYFSAKDFQEMINNGNCEKLKIKN